MRVSVRGRPGLRGLELGLRELRLCAHGCGSLPSCLTKGGGHLGISEIRVYGLGFRVSEIRGT